MFKWITDLGGNSDRPHLPIQPQLDLATIRTLEKAVVFKHSRSCPVSWAACAQVRRFTKANPLVPVYTVTIQEDRSLSRAIADQTGISHQSPQVIIFRNGHVVASASHESVTEQYLTSMVA